VRFSFRSRCARSARNPREAGRCGQPRTPPPAPCGLNQGIAPGAGFAGALPNLRSQWRHYRQDVRPQLGANCLKRARQAGAPFRMSPAPAKHLDRPEPEAAEVKAMCDVGVRADPILDLGRLDRLIAYGARITSTMASPRFSRGAHGAARWRRSCSGCVGEIGTVVHGPSPSVSEWPAQSTRPGRWKESATGG
jgi:hypothetical protein